MSGGIIALFIAIAIAIGAGSWYLKKKRREEMAAVAQKLGMQYQPYDPFGLDQTLPHRLFTLGDGRGCENVVWGKFQQASVCAFDYWYYTQSTDSKGRSSRTYHRFSCVARRIPVRCADLIVTKENLFTRLADGLGFRDIEFETEEFNRAWQVKCPDAKFANDLIDQRMMEWLMHAGTDWSFELAGSVAVVYARKLPPSHLPALLQCAAQFVERIPRVVYDLYPAAGGPAAEAGGW